ncbi:LysR family transcriptional regulator [Mesorhizobium sp. M0040]
MAVAEELHFGRAAARLHISQPPLTKQIQQLEQAMGVRLLERTKRKVELTAAGRVFLDEVRAVLHQTEQAVEPIVAKPAILLSDSSTRLSTAWCLLSSNASPSAIPRSS